MTEVILIMILAICLLLIYFLYKTLEKRGLYFSLVILNILTFILTFKITTVFKMNTNQGIITLVPMLSIFYIYLIKYGKRDIKQLMIISLITNIVTAIIITTLNYYVPAITETISINIEGTFQYHYKILIIFPIIMLLSEYLITKLYAFIIELQNNNFISIILTYIITGLIYTVMFSVIGYIKKFDIKSSIFLGITTYIIGLILTLICTPFITYITGSKKVRK